MSPDVIYTIGSTANGGGRDGHVVSDTGRIDLELRPPKELGGSGEGSNPEELFSAGYSACFLGAVHAVARADKLKVPADSTIKVTVGFGKDEGGFGLNVAIAGHFPGLTQEEADALLAKAHTVCPYSRATAGNIDHALTATV